MELAAFLSSHHGIITRARALEFGLTRHQIDYRVSSGRWLVLGAGIYRVATSPDTWESRARAAALRGRGLVSHRSALRVFGVDGYDRVRRIDVTTSVRHRSAAAPGVRIHRSRQFDRITVNVVDSIPVVGVGWAVISTASRAGDDEIDRILDAVLRQALVSLDELTATAADLGRGMHGIGRLKRLLAQRHAEDRPPDSVFNRLIGQILVRAGLPRPVFEFEVFTNGRFVGRADLAYPDHRLLIECDSARWHRTREAFEADPRRRNRLLAAGYRLIAFTWADYRDRPDEIVATVRAMLRNSAA